jgi:hypothetical protein
MIWIDIQWEISWNVGENPPVIKQYQTRLAGRPIILIYILMGSVY